MVSEILGTEMKAEERMIQHKKRRGSKISEGEVGEVQTRRKKYKYVLLMQFKKMDP